MRNTARSGRRGARKLAKVESYSYVSTMESYDSPKASLEAIEKGSVMAWTRYPPVPPWFYPILGATMGTLSMMVPFGRFNPVAAVAASLVAAGASGATAGSYRKLRGQTPIRNIPPELQRLITAAVSIIVIVYGGLFVLSFTPFWPANPALGAILAWIAGAPFERRYRQAADAAERRVGLQ